MNSLNIMIVGVGGQGTLLASRILGHVAVKKNYDVKVSEVHGMSQRGGSVVTYVKMGDKVFSPLIEKGEADIVISFEKLEALRWLPYLKESGKMIVNNQRIDPMPVIIGKAEYPSDVLEVIKQNYEKSIIIDALALAKKLGNIKVVNTILLGVMASLTSIEKEVWLVSLSETVPSKVIDLNVKAFEEGYNLK